MCVFLGEVARAISAYDGASASRADIFRKLKLTGAHDAELLPADEDGCNTSRMSMRLFAAT